jgi:hypothetical protein
VSNTTIYAILRSLVVTNVVVAEPLNFGNRIRPPIVVKRPQAQDFGGQRLGVDYFELFDIKAVEDPSARWRTSPILGSGQANRLEKMLTELLGIDRLA